jgi:hypothetical protein
MMQEERWEDVRTPNERLRDEGWRPPSNRMRDRTYDISIGMNGTLHGRIVLVCLTHGPFSHMLDPLPPGHLWEGEPICPSCRVEEQRQ